MNIGQYPHSLVTFAILTGLVFSCCNKDKCPDVTETTHNVPDVDQTIFPYGGSDTITLLYNGTDTLKFVGKGKKIGYNQNQGLTGGGCSGDIDKLEAIGVDHVSAFFPAKLSCGISLYTIGVSSVDISFSGSSFSYDAFLIRGGTTSMTVLNKSYSNVSLFYSTKPGDSLWYSKTFGIIKISTPTSRWELLK